MFCTPQSRDRSLAARMERARQSGYADGGREARLMLIALGKQFERSKAIGWLNTAVEKGRADKLGQRAIGREIDAYPNGRDAGRVQRRTINSAKAATTVLTL